MIQSVSLFRLRIGPQVVGYLRVYANGVLEYSADQFWWHGNPIEYTQKDQYSGLKDKNNRSLFEHDVVAIRESLNKHPKQAGVIQFKPDRDAFVWVDMTANRILDLFADHIPLFHKSECTFLGFAFDKNSN